MNQANENPTPLPEEIAAAEKIVAQCVGLESERAANTVAAILAAHRTALVARLVTQEARLRAALSRILDNCRDADCGDHCPNSCMYCQGRDALQPAPALDLETRVAEWVRTRIGPEHMHSRERAMRLLEEAVELAQAEGVSLDDAQKQVGYVFSRPAGEPSQEAGGVAACLLGWCAATSNKLLDIATREVERIEAKPVEQIRGSVARKQDQDLVRCKAAPALDLAEVEREVGAVETRLTDAMNVSDHQSMRELVRVAIDDLAALLARLREVQRG